MHQNSLNQVEEGEGDDVGLSCGRSTVPKNCLKWEVFSNLFWLVVEPTHLKNMKVKLDHFPPIKNGGNHHLALFDLEPNNPNPFKFDFDTHETTKGFEDVIYVTPRVDKISERQTQSLYSTCPKKGAKDDGHKPCCSITWMNLVASYISSSLSISYSHSYSHSH